MCACVQAGARGVRGQLWGVGSPCHHRSGLELRFRGVAVKPAPPDGLPDLLVSLSLLVSLTRSWLWRVVLFLKHREEAYWLLSSKDSYYLKRYTCEVLSAEAARGFLLENSVSTGLHWGWRPHSPKWALGGRRDIFIPIVSYLERKRKCFFFFFFLEPGLAGLEFVNLPFPSHVLGLLVHTIVPSQTFDK